MLSNILRRTGRKGLRLLSRFMPGIRVIGLKLKLFATALIVVIVGTWLVTSLILQQFTGKYDQEQWADWVKTGRPLAGFDASGMVKLEEVREKYQQAASGTINPDNNDEAPYEVPWVIMFAIDDVLFDTRFYNGEELARELAPRFERRTIEIERRTKVTTTCDVDNEAVESENIETDVMEVILSVDTWEGVYTHTYSPYEEVYDHQEVWGDCVMEFTTFEKGERLASISFEEDMTRLHDVMENLAGSAVPELDKDLVVLALETYYGVGAWAGNASYYEPDIVVGEGPPYTGANSKHGYVWPVPNYTFISSYFGPRIDPVNRRRQAFHHGIDIVAPLNAPVVAAKSGTVVHVVASCRTGDLRCGENWGNHVRILHDDGNLTLYAHLSRVDGAVGVGATVRQGQRIGLIGSTGYSTGAHLHFELWGNGQRQFAKNPADVLIP